MAIMAGGYPPTTVRFCPECGSGNIDVNNHWQGDGQLKCNDCGLVCIIIEGDESHSDM